MKATTPKQSRAKNTIEVIIEATGLCLMNNGYAKTSTNHVAKKAGVSIGSLYRYFPNKEILIKSFIVEHCNMSKELLISELSLVSKKPIKDIILRTVDVVIRHHCEFEKLSRIINTELPAAHYLLIQQHYSDCALIVESFLSAHSNKVSVKDIKLASQIVVNSIVGAFLGAESLDTEAKRAHFIEQVQRLSTGYLLN